MARERDTRNRILGAARALLHARSYGDVGVQEICEAAQVQKGSFYHFFPSKRDLALAVIADYAADWADGVLAEAFDPALPPLQRLDCLGDVAYAWHKARQTVAGRMAGCPLGNLALELSTRDEGIRTELVAAFGRVGARIRTTLEEAVSGGELPPLDTAATADAMLAFLQGATLLAKARNDPELLRHLGPALRTLRVASR